VPWESHGLQPWEEVNVDRVHHTVFLIELVQVRGDLAVGELEVGALVHDLSPRDDDILTRRVKLDRRILSEKLEHLADCRVARFVVKVIEHLLLNTGEETSSRERAIGDRRDDVACSLSVSLRDGEGWTVRGRIEHTRIEENVTSSDHGVSPRLAPP
jgi:hypothetical protein